MRVGVLLVVIGVVAVGCGDDDAPPADCRLGKIVPLVGGEPCPSTEALNRDCRVLCDDSKATNCRCGPSVVPGLKEITCSVPAICIR